MLEEGRLYKVDTRLRPSGEQGLLVTSWSAFERYHRDEAAGWERVALLRARVVYSNEEPGAACGARGAAARDRVRPPVRPAAVRRRSAPRARARSRASAAACRRGRATCASIRAASWTSSSWSRSASSPTPPIDGVRTTTTGTALARLVALGWPESLLDDYAALRRATLRLRLLLDRPEDVVSPRDLPMLARSLGTSPEALGRRPRRPPRPRARDLRGPVLTPVPLAPRSGERARVRGLRGQHGRSSPGPAAAPEQIGKIVRKAKDC